MSASKTRIIKRFSVFILMFSQLCFSAYSFSALNKASELNINQKNLVILQYHHVSSETPTSTSVTPETFESHMAFLAKHYKIIDLAEALLKIKNNEALPNKSVAITFDDGYDNILQNAHPILMKYNFPYTIFVNPAIIGEFSSQLTWPQIKQMQPLATFANHTLDHAHLLAKGAKESSQQWLKRVMNDVNQAEKILAEKVGYSKKWLAYPFGEFNKALKNELLAQGYIGFGQQSGGISVFSDFGALPRFPAAGPYAKLDSLETKLNSFAMPVKNLSVDDSEFRLNETLDSLRFEIDDRDVRVSALTCYFKGGTLPIEQRDSLSIITVDHKMVPGRARINCTAPSNAFTGRFYWYSFPMFTPTKDGEFLD